MIKAVSLSRLQKGTALQMRSPGNGVISVGRSRKKKKKPYPGRISAEKKNRVKTKLTQKDNKQIEDALNKSIYSVADLNKMLGSDFGTIEEKLLDEYIRNKSKKESAYAQTRENGFFMIRKLSRPEMMYSGYSSTLIRFSV